MEEMLEDTSTPADEELLDMVSNLEKHVWRLEERVEVIVKATTQILASVKKFDEMAQALDASGLSSMLGMK